VIRIPILHDDPNAIPVNPNCGRCTAVCCNYVSIEIDAPTSARDFDIIRWYLIHPGVRVYCEDSSGSWFVQFMSRCRFLRPDNLCGIYDTRPQICRDLDPTLCEFALGAGDRYLFTNIEEFDRWFAERERQRLERRERAAARKTARNSHAAPRRVPSRVPRKALPKAAVNGRRKTARKPAVKA
jgi:Fe-S-cluster containining protein